MTGDNSVDALIEALSHSDSTLVVTCGCDCDGEQVLPEARAGLSTGNGCPDLYVRERYAEGASLLSEPSVESAIETVASAAADGAIYAQCPDCDSYTRLPEVMEGTTGTDDGNRPALYLSGPDAKDSPPPGTLVCVALDEMLIECPECSETVPRAKAIREGPDAPELGWRYCECPACGERRHISTVEGTA